jgi:hypothetical protein
MFTLHILISSQIQKEKRTGTALKSLGQHQMESGSQHISAQLDLKDAMSISDSTYQLRVLKYF